MAKLYPIQKSFSAGQLSPFIAARSDLEYYSEGVQTLQNFICDARGPVRMRTGSKFLTKIPIAGEPGQYTCNVIPLDIWNAPKDAVAVFYANKVWIYDTEGALQLTADYDCGFTEEQIQYAVTPTNDFVYMVNRNHEPMKIYYDGAWKFDAVGFTGLPGNPRAIAFFQGRLWLGNFSGVTTMTFMGSESGIFTNFTVPTPPPETLVASDPVRYGIADDGDIQWMVGQRTLIIGTTYGEYTANTPEGQSVLGAEVLPDIIQQSAFGSQPIQGSKVAQGVFYVTADSERLRDIRYQWVANGYMSNDVSFLFKGSTSSRGLPIAGKASHLTKLAYSQNPFSIIWLPDRDGGMSGCAFEMVTAEKSVFGWSTHPTQWNEVEQKYTGLWRSVAVTQSSGRSTTWLLVDRAGTPTGDSDQRTLFLERGMLPDEEYYTDSYQTYEISATTYPEGTDTISTTDLPHLDNLQGQTLRVIIETASSSGGLADRSPATLALFTYTGGSISLPQTFLPGTKVTIGLPYKGKIVTMPMDKDSKAGSAMGWRKRWDKIVLRIFDSHVPTVNGQIAPYTYPSTPMGLGQPERQQADITYRNLGWDDTGRITIEQEQPMRTQILAIFGETAFDTL